MPYLPHEVIVSKILVRLPTRSLLRLRCVCKAWRNAISGDPFFFQAHLRWLHQQDKKPCSLLIAPRINGDLVVWGYWIRRKVATPGLYLWEESQKGFATLLHDISYSPPEVRMHEIAHCDGLVLLPTEATVRVVNPATRQVFTLPWRPNSIDPRRCFQGKSHRAFGFGRDHRSNVYKVAHFFHREELAMGGFGMEVFSIGKDKYWRETVVQPPYPFIVGQTATFFKGSLIWKVDDHSLLDDAADAPCFVRFSLEDESFNIMAAPPWYQYFNNEESILADLRGELAMTRLPPSSETIVVEIWMCNNVDGTDTPQWDRRHVLHFPLLASPIHLIAVIDDGILFQCGKMILCHQFFRKIKVIAQLDALKYHNPDINTVVGYPSKTVEDFGVISYIPSLVPI